MNSRGKYPRAIKRIAAGYWIHVCNIALWGGGTYIYYHIFSR